MNIIRTISTLILATMFISGTVMAEGEKLADKLSNAVVEVHIDIESCNADAAILCPGLPLNSRKSFACLMAYEDNLSTACTLGIIEAAMSVELGLLAIEHSIQACEADADKYCLKAKAGEGRIVSCLKKNESKLDKKCISALKEPGLWGMGAK